MSDGARGNGETEAAGQDTALKVVGSPSEVPSVFVDSCMFAAVAGSIAKLQFVEFIPGARDSADPGLKMKHIVNLVMPIEGFMNTVEYLNSVAKPLRTQNGE